jgi:sugar transferase EpsL
LINDDCRESATRGPAGSRAKRLFDVVVAGVLLAVAGPVGIVAGLAIRWKMGPPALFKQERPGLDEHPFTMFKLRTMVPPRSVDYERDVVRITALGAMLRRLSIDEIPQLWNILRGDMSLVGPRPLLQRYLPYFKPEERVRFMARPGVTGLAQVSGRNSLSWDERLALDAEYVDEWTFVGDLRILARTAVRVISASGVALDVNEALADLDVERAATVDSEARADGVCCTSG